MWGKKENLRFNQFAKIDFKSIIWYGKFLKQKNQRIFQMSGVGRRLGRSFKINIKSTISRNWIHFLPHDFTLFDNKKGSEFLWWMKITSWKTFFAYVGPFYPNAIKHCHVVNRVRFLFTTISKEPGQNDRKNQNLVVFLLFSVFPKFSVKLRG